MSYVCATRAEVAAPGYINFHLNPDWLKQQTDAIIGEGDALYRLDIGAGKRAQVEFVSANPSGPITIGRSRGGVLDRQADRLDRTVRTGLSDAGVTSVARALVFKPISMSFRHFGNVASGTVVTALVYAALSALSAAVFKFLPGALASIPFFQVGLPAVLSLYFDIFSSCIQAFIFSMLTMAYVSAAAQ